MTPRLEPVRYDIAGIEVDDPVRFHDRARGEDCSAMTWADGATYCTPAHTDAVYTDPLCTSPLARTQDAPTGYVATYFNLRGDVSLRRLWPVVAEVAPPSQYWVLEATECIGPYAGDSSMHYATVSPELDETHFVRLLRSAPQGNARVQRIAIDTDDGMHVVSAFHDRTIGADCALEYPSDVASPRCVPEAAPFTTLFSDASCSQPLLQVPADPPAFAQFGTTDCPSYGAVTDEVTGTPVFDQVSGTCTPVTLPHGYRVYAVGAALDLQQVTRETGAAARIEPVTVVTGSEKAADTFVHDNQLAADCSPGLLAGSWRCLPAVAQITSSYFIDDQCQDPIDVALVPRSACAPAPKFAYEPETIHAIGDAVPMQLYEVSTGDRCVPYNPVPPLIAHLVGPPLPAETFAAADVRY